MGNTHTEPLQHNNTIDLGLVDANNHPQATYMCAVWSEPVLFVGAFQAFDRGGDGTIRLNVLEVSDLKI